MEPEVLRKLNELTELDILRAVDRVPMELVVALLALRAMNQELGDAAIAGSIAKYAGLTDE
jgi:hypothetical protein